MLNRPVDICFAHFMIVFPQALPLKCKKNLLLIETALNSINIFVCFRRVAVSFCVIVSALCNICAYVVLSVLSRIFVYHLSHSLTCFYRYLLSCSHLRQFRQCFLSADANKHVTSADVSKQQQHVESAELGVHATRSRTFLRQNTEECLQVSFLLL